MAQPLEETRKGLVQQRFFQIVQRGEFALVLHPAAIMPGVAPDTRVLKLLLAQLPLKTAVKLAADITGEPRNALYQLALTLKAAGPG